MSNKNIFQIVVPIIVVSMFWSTLISELNHPNNVYDSDTFVSTNITEYQTNESYQLGKPYEKTIILRMDDVQGYLWKDVSIKLIDTILEKNMSVSLGVIPMRESITMNNYLRGKASDNRIEIVQHGTYHSLDEIQKISDDEAYSLTKIGKEKMINNLGIVPITYIPPYNSNGENSTRVLKRLGFKIFSSGPNKFVFDGNIIDIGFDTQTKLSSSTKLIPLESIIDDCKLSLKNKNLCVIMIHPQDYVGNDDKTLDEGKYNEFRAMLDELKKLDVKSVTFKDLLK